MNMAEKVRNCIIYSILGILLLTLSLSLMVESKAVFRKIGSTRRLIETKHDLIAMPTNIEYRRNVDENPSTGYSPETESEVVEHQQVYYMLPNGQTIEASKYHSGIDTTTDSVNEDANSDTGSGLREKIFKANVDQTHREDGYPGEIVYANQNDQIVPTQDSQSDELVTKINSEAGSLIRNNPALAATILTEIPVKDISDQVLEQLKNEYGAKVVATREYPGANLVINCADQSEISLCSSPSRHLTGPSYSTKDEPNDEPENQPDINEPLEHELADHDVDRLAERVTEKPNDTYTTTTQTEPQTETNEYARVYNATEPSEISPDQNQEASTSSQRSSVEGSKIVTRVSKKKNL